MLNQPTLNNTENSSDLAALLQRLSVVQIRFCVARCETKTDKEAAEMIGITPNVVKGWNDDKTKQLVDDAVKIMTFDGVITAIELRRRHLAKAMAVKVSALDSNNEKLKQDVATEIIEWELGKATQPTDNKYSGEVSYRVRFTKND